MYIVHWNPSITGTIGNQHLSLIARCPQLRGFQYISGLCDQAVEHNVFSEFSLLYAGKEG